MIQCITHAAILVVYIYSHAAKLSISPVASYSEVNRYFINQAQQIIIQYIYNMLRQIVCVFIVLCTSECALSELPESVNHQLDRPTETQLQSAECPVWFEKDSGSEKCHCFQYYAARCFDGKAYLFSGYCATYDEATDIVHMSFCPYNGFSYSQQDTNWYLELPENISILNDYMCGPLNRDGKVCSRCKEGYGHSPTSVGFDYFECSKCNGEWYGILLYLILEFLPITVFYLIILVLQVNIISAPMTTYIMFCQMIVVCFDCRFSGSEVHIRETLFLINQHSEWFFSVLMTLCDVWNLRFFQYVLPPFCVSERLKPIHLAFLGYVSVFYPLFLIALTWFCVWLHGRNFTPLVFLSRPFHRCLAHIMRNERDMSRDLVNVFVSFLLLSFTKVYYQFALLLVSKKLKRIQYNQGDFEYLKYELVVGVDYSVIYGSTEHLVFLIPSAIFTLVFSLPCFLVLFYPFKVFRKLLSLCGLDLISLKFFLEKLYACYRDSLDGGRDMRSFAGLYTILRPILFLSQMIAGWLLIANNDPFLVRSVVFILTILVVCIVKPYKKSYMTNVDIAFLSLEVIFCHFMSTEESFSKRENVAYTCCVILAIPSTCFLFVLVGRVIFKCVKITVFRHFFQKCKFYYNCFKLQLAHCFQKFATFSEEQEPLIDPTATEDTYGTY